MRRVYPYTIANGAGEWLTFDRRVQDADGDRVEGTTRVSPGAGPPMHVHYLEDEGFTVLEGRIGYQLAGAKPAYAEAGESLVFRAGVAHRFWNAGEGELRCRAWVSPVGNIEYFLGAIFASQQANGGKRPSLFDVAYLTHRYRTEYRMMAVPMLVQRWIFPVVVAIGTAFGKYAKYADAPAPLNPSS